MKPVTILVVDDEPDFVFLMKTLLESRGYIIDTAYGGEEALQKVTTKPDLILLDVNMPDLSGLEVCRKIRENQEYNDIAIIVLSARNESADKVDGLYIGADDYVTKPFDNHELLARIQAALRRNFFGKQTKEEISELLVELRRIIQERSITPYFQPIFSVKTLGLFGFEVFCRPPRGGSLDNTEVLFKAAEAFNMYSELERLCWSTAITKWNEMVNSGNLFLNCNSAFVENDVLKQILSDDLAVDPKHIMLEITEIMSVRDYPKFIRQLKKIKEKGVKITVSDIGGARANLELAKKIQPDFVKISMSLIRDIHVDQFKQNIVESILDFCERNDIVTIAEGLESHKDFTFVSKLGIDAAQGMLLAVPSQTVDEELLKIDPDDTAFS